ncbi:MAG TPA: NF038132 family protein [Sphingomonas sp.]|uniref:NF038132 family protein n=1 Tax=Sphingomonas sp. TaxID=28214 RepID=UPI002B511436|nr:NF038132 family protein [Sphingomonas sp.]HMI20940.1 NF038132 family protein [Sphingomonas sp.]
MRIKTLLTGAAFAGFAMIAASSASASTCIGSCGTLGADGNVSAPPVGPTYTYVTTSGGASGAGQIAGAGGTNGSEFLTSSFSANSGDLLDFYFNYVTSDGSGYSDYGFAELLTSSLTHVAWLFTARTIPSGDTSPGFGLPSNDSTLIPATTPIQGGTTWSPLGGYSGTCYSSGCGHTGWIESQYTISDAGNYVLRLGATNSVDSQYDSGLAFAGVTVGGNDVPLSAPEPASWAMMLGGFGLIGGMMRRRRTAVAFG